MIPVELYEAWEEHLEHEELLFLADHGGGWPNCLVNFSPTPADRLRILRQMGFRVAEQYDMPSNAAWDKLDLDDMEPWCRLTNDIVVNLAGGFVNRAHSGGGAESE